MLLHKSISVIKYFISVSVWVHWAMYCDLKKKFSSFPTQSLNLIHHCYNRSRCSRRKKSSQQSCSILPVEIHKARFGYGGVCILYICAYQKDYGNSANHMWMWPANCILHLTQLLAGRVVHVDGGCAAGARPSIWWDDKVHPLCGGFCCSEASPTSLTHPLHAMQKYPLFKHFINLMDIADEIWDILSVSWEHIKPQPGKCEILKEWKQTEKLK